LMASLWTKGTRRYSANQIARISESLGMDLSGYAGRNSYGLTATLLSEDIVKGLDLIEDVIKNPAFSQEELDKDREFMKSVIRARDDNIFRYSDQKLRELLFETHPFRLSTQGTEETLDLILRDDIVELYDRLTAPNHMVISIFGDIDPTEMAKDLKKRFSTLTRKDVTLSEYMEEPPVTTREKNITLKKEQAMVMYGFMAPEIDDEDYYGIEILTAILGSSFSGRMFANIREQLGQAYTLGGQYVPGLDSGYMFFYILTTADSVPKVKELMDKEFRDLQLQPVSEKELTGIKTYLKGTYEASHQTNHALSFTSVLDELYGLGYNRYQNYQAGIDQVTARDIVRLANEYLDLQKGALLTVTPESLHSKQTMLK